jgi:hypothetical protein
MESFIELHDSELVAVLELGSQAIVLLRAYMHTSEGRIGIDPGNGWVQAALLTFATDATIEGDVPDLPSDIYNGELVLDGVAHRNVIPIPLHHVGAASLKLLLNATPELVISGTGIDLTLVGEAVHVEAIPANFGRPEFLGP